MIKINIFNFMITSIIIHSIAFFYLLVGTISDIHTREVSDWLNYGLISVGIAVNIIFSLVLNDWSYTMNSLFGFGVFLLLAFALFYTGQWGGGDSKMLMGLGALYGMGFKWIDSSFLVYFLINMLIAGAIYGIVWSIIAAIRHRKKFMKEYNKIVSKKFLRIIRYLALAAFAVAILVFFLVDELSVKLFVIGLALLFFFTFYLWSVIKAVENACMYKLVVPAELTEGDWIAKDIKYQGKYITGPKDLGIRKKQINILKKLYKEKKIRKILIKEGIPFVPSFFLGWIITLILNQYLVNLLH